MPSSTVAQQAPARNLNRGWWPMLPEWSRRVLKPVLNEQRRLGRGRFRARKVLPRATSSIRRCGTSPDGGIGPGWGRCQA